MSYPGLWVVKYMRYFSDYQFEFDSAEEALAFIDADTVDYYPYAVVLPDGRELKPDPNPWTGGPRVLAEMLRAEI